MKNPQRSRKSAFTLVELLVAIAVIAALTLLGFSAMSRTGEKAKEAGCIANLKRIGTALLAYAADHRQTLPFVAGQFPYNAPVTIARELVGTYGEAGYLDWNGERKVHWWSDTMLCPADPNASLYRRVYYYPASYVYRQNEEAGDAGTKAISLVSRRSEQEGYKRWVVMDRCILGAAGLVKPYPGSSTANATPAGRWEPDRRSYSSYWHHKASNVLYEDGSVAVRSKDETVSP